MPSIQKRPNFFETEAGHEIEEMLRSMQLDTAYNTEDSYSPDSALYPDNNVTFLQKHKSYLIANPSVDPVSYVSNLRLKTRLRR